LRTDAARNRSNILDAARRLVAQQGATASMDDIALAAGVAVGTLYRHYPTKTDLVAAVVEDSMMSMAQTTEEALAAVQVGADAWPELERLFRTLSARHAQDKAAKAAASLLGKALPDPTVTPEPGSPSGRAAAAVTALLARARAAGAVRDDVTLVDLALLLDGLPGDGVPQDVRDRYVDIVLAGLAAPRHSPRG
jgi:AcrR family transcriptional regulator